MRLPVKNNAPSIITLLSTIDKEVPGASQCEIKPLDNHYKYSHTLQQPSNDFLKVIPELSKSLSQRNIGT